jgi:amino acid permease
MTKFVIGIGILSTSHAVKESGYLLSSTVIVIIAALCGYGMLLLIWVVDDMKNPDVTIMGIGKIVAGRGT